MNSYSNLMKTMIAMVPFLAATASASAYLLKYNVDELDDLANASFVM